MNINNNGHKQPILSKQHKRCSSSCLSLDASKINHMVCIWPIRKVSIRKAGSST